ENLQTIGNHAFAYNELEKVKLPRNVKEVGLYTFGGNSLTEVTIYNPNMIFGVNVFAENQDVNADVVLRGYKPSTTYDYAGDIVNQHGFDEITDGIARLFPTRFVLKPTLPILYKDLFNNSLG